MLNKNKDSKIDTGICKVGWKFTKQNKTKKNVNIFKAKKRIALKNKVRLCKWLVKKKKLYAKNFQNMNFHLVNWSHFPKEKQFLITSIHNIFQELQVFFYKNIKYSFIKISKKHFLYWKKKTKNYVLQIYILDFHS